MSDCVRDAPFPVVAARVRRSPFARKQHRSIQEAIALVHASIARWSASDSIGFTYVASLKSMGLIPRANGRYVLGPKYCAKK